MDMQLELIGVTRPAFELSFDLDQMAGVFLSGAPSFGLSAQLQRTSAWDKQGGIYPIITELHGVLNSSTGNDMLGAPLLPPEALPVSLATRDSQASLSLTFALSNRYVQFLEEERVAKQGGRDMRLGMRFWGTVALAAPAAPQEFAESSSIDMLRWDQPATIVGFRQVRSGVNAKEIRIPRSDWIDRLLPSLGYERSVLIELPLTRTPPISEPLKQAAASLDAARKAFDHEDYRAVLKYGRDVLEHIGDLAPDQKLTTFCQETLAPRAGKTKSEMMDGAMNVLRGVLNAGAHANDFVPDRAIAAYVIETLAIQLRYISVVVSL